MIQRDALLLFDSFAADAAIGTRAVMTNERTLLFHSDRVTVDAALRSDACALSIVHGQVLRGDAGLPMANVRVTLREDGAECDSVHTDEFGQFSVGGVASGAEQELHIHTAIEQVRCVIPGAVAPKGF